MITRYNPPFRSEVPPQWRGACAAVAGGGPNRATAIVVARLVFTISGQSRAFTALRLIDVVTASHSHINELATLEFGLQQLARLEDELAPHGAVPSEPEPAYFIRGRSTSSSSIGSEPISLPTCGRCARPSVRPI